MAHHVSSSHNEELPLRELLEALLGVEGRRRLMLRRMTNEELFQLYDGDLVLRLPPPKTSVTQGNFLPDSTNTSTTISRFKRY